MTSSPKNSENSKDSFLVALVRIKYHIVVPRQIY